jgi:hypothetical protein
VANAGLKVVLVSARYERPIRVANKGVTAGEFCEMVELSGARRGMGRINIV